MNIAPPSTSPEYKAWAAMVHRCRPGTQSALYYFHRGIKVCPEWETNFEKFFEDVGARPTSKHVFMRKDVNKGFYLDNCKWDTRPSMLKDRTRCEI
jgi:hypothetical protein